MGIELAWSEKMQKAQLTEYLALLDSFVQSFRKGTHFSIENPKHVL
jgi:hypothetical protein